MVVRDEGPSYNLGFGQYRRPQDSRLDTTNVEGPNPESGPVAKALHDHPLMKFIAAGAAMMVGMHTAGAVVKKGGVRLAMSASSHAGEGWLKDFSVLYRQTQRIFDDMEGVARTFADPSDPTKIYASKSGGTVISGVDDILRDKTKIVRGFHISDGEARAAIREGRDVTPADWTMGDEIRQRLVGQARRLPYELPALYLTQRMAVDPLMGTGGDKKVNWFNPVDVTTDFVDQSVKNLALMIGPFEAGAGAATHSARKVFSYGSGSIVADPSKIALRKSVVTLQASLEQLGHNAASMLDNVVKFSKQSSGAFSAGIEEASKTRIGIVQALHKLNRGDYAAMLEAKKGVAAKTIGILDNMPGSIGGVASGIRAGRVRFNEIGASHDAFNKLMRLGRTEFDKSASDIEKQVLRSHFSTSPLVDLAEDIKGLAKGSSVVTGKKPGTFTHDWRESSFYKDGLQDEYQKKIESNLKARFLDDGMSKNDASKLARDFSEQHKIKFSEQANTDISQRLLVGKEKQFLDVEENSSFVSTFVDRLSKYNVREKTLLANNLESVIQETDNMFSSSLNGTMSPYRKGVEKRLKSQWTSYANNDLKEMTAHMQGTSKLDFHSFDMRIGGEDHKYLLKKAASQAGLDVDALASHPNAEGLYKNYLDSLGLKSNSPDNLRGFLTQEKVVAKPWQKNGYNILGIRKVTTESFLTKGLHGDDQDIKRIIGNLSKTEDRVASTVPGLYETRGGHIIDINTMRHSVNKSLDSLASNYKLPIVNFNPLELIGYGKKVASTETNVLSRISGSSRQPFLGSEAEGADFFMMVRKGGRAAKGEVRAFKAGQESRSLGMYQPTSASSVGMAGRQARIASGDLGYAPLEQPKAHQSRLRRIFLRNQAPYQQGSVGGLIGRFSNRMHDVKNPTTMAKLLKGEAVSDAKGTYALKDGELLDGAGSVIASRAEVARSVDIFHKFVGRNVFPKALHENKSVSAGMESLFNRLKSVFSYDFGNGVKSTRMLKGRTALADMKTTEEKVLFAKGLEERVTGEIQSLHAAGQTEMANQLKRAQKTMISSHLSGASGSGYWDKFVGQGTGIRRRVDLLTSDMQQFLAMRQGIVGTGDEFAGTVADMAAQIKELKRTGILSSTEAVEANAALLSTQLHYSKIKTFDNTESVIENSIKVIDDITGGNSPLLDALDDVASGLTGNTSGSTSRVATSAKSFRTRHFGMAKEEYGGLSYNPFGDTNIVLTPTVGQAFKTEGVKQTLLSMVGVNTYKNPRAFNTVSNMTSHMFDRLNRYASVFGAGVDPTKFSGPLSMFGKGIIGQRVAPLYIAGTVAVAADATLGGVLNGKDGNGNRIYSPYIMGQAARPLAELQAGVAGIVPGGQTYGEARDDIFNGEVPVRKARYWPLGRTPFRGQGVEYYRPSWYRRLQAGTQYPTGFDNPVERLMYGYDFSPLRPLDPYRFEKKHAKDRPYPVSGDYFSGPFGPITPLLNDTIGRVLKPRKYYEPSETQGELATQYAPVGQSGAYRTTAYGATGPGLGRAGGYSVFNTLGATTGGDIAGISNSRYGANVGKPQYTGSGIAAGSIASNNARLTAAAYGGGSGYGNNGNAVQTMYGLPSLPGVMQPSVIANLKPVSEGGFQMQARSIGYRTQETLGIYGFAFGAVRSKLGFGTQDFAPKASVLESSTNAYSAGRGFWNLGIGGIGDAPSETLDLNMSEAVRRLVPHRPSGVDYINPIRNTMGQLYPWMPGAEYYKDFTRGDPYTSVPEGEFRLPGAAYERLNQLHGGGAGVGRYGPIDIHKILGNIAPYSQKYEEADKALDTIGLSPAEQLQVETTRRQVASVRHKHDFSEYQYRDRPASWVEKRYEQALHTDNMLFRKMGRRSSALEDWERNNVYGPTFQQWQKPYQSFIAPMINQSTQKNPLFAAGHLGLVASFFGRNPEAKVMASSVGAMTGAAAGSYGTLYKAITGDRFIPLDRKKQAALEEYSDLTTYVKNKGLQEAAAKAGDSLAAEQFRRAAGRTMFGLDLNTATIDDVLAAIPKRKREHFKSFLSAPERERNQILSTAPRLERRILQAAWGRQVENLPDLNDFYKNRELPGPDWEGWHPNTNAEYVKIKMGQSMGLDMSQMGYYPQQVKQANLVNPSFPIFGFNDDQRNVQARLEAIMAGMGAGGSVSAYPNNFGGNELRVDQGVFA